ncbi:MAG: nucleotidyltransferase domain-containing protein [Actinobacteria bacterium]|nr:MAG: nucleotidyltransferase domain-containing protein [Actinomycetota bacterium]
MPPDSIVARVAAWAPGRRDILGAGLAGSKLILLAEDVTAYTQHAEWIQALGATRIVRTERLGPLTERRLALRSGLELEVGIVDPSWASVVPLDEATRRVVENGFRILHDPHGLLRALVAAVVARA